MKRYRGILFIKRDQLSQLAGGGSGVVWDAYLAGGKLHVVWSGGRHGGVALDKVLQQARLDPGVPAPSLAFVADQEGGAVGLLFEASTPTPGLRYVEPHSLVFPMGWLARDGLQPAP